MIGHLEQRLYASARFRIRRRLAKYELDVWRAAGAQIGEDVRLPTGSTLTRHTRIDDHAWITSPIFVDGSEVVSIGRWAALGGGIRIISSNHRMNFPSLHMGVRPELPALLTDGDRGPIRIGPATWVGDSVVLLPGSDVGTGSVVGAGSIVTGPIPAFSIAVGSPARVVRPRFSEEMIEVLALTTWWNWTDQQIARRRSFFMADLNSASPEEVLRLAGQ